MHKHFRMLSITNLMANHGVMDIHTRPPGIWKKLGTLYDMKLMDERVCLPLLIWMKFVVVFFADLGWCDMI